MPKAKKNTVTAVEELTHIESFSLALIDYKEIFLKANYKLEQIKLEWLDLNSEVVNNIFNEVFVAREELFITILSVPKLQKQEMAQVVLDLYNESTGLTKRSFIDIRAFFINQGIC